MRSSLIPLREFPNVSNLVAAIKNGFSIFFQADPKIEIKSDNTSISIYVSGQENDKWCWVEVFSWPYDERDELAKDFMCAISSRGENLFCAQVAYGICRIFNEILIDEAGYAGAGKVFTADQLEEKLKT